MHKEGGFSMADKIDIFPSSKFEALAMLYLQNQDLSGLTPEEIYDKYQDAYERIYSHRQAKKAKIINSPM